MYFVLFCLLHIVLITTHRILIHGKNSLNPNFYKWFIVPGAMYLLERILRVIRGRHSVGVVSVTHLNNEKAKVYCLELEKTGHLKNQREGQYVFIKCDLINQWQWHPFTISSPPHQKTLSLHIRNMGKNTWTDQLQNYLQAMSPNKAYYEAYHRKGLSLTPQKIGPDGSNLIKIDGPIAAPNQHLGRYVTSMIIGAGIGVTPVRAALQSIVYYRFKHGVGYSYPHKAYCIWIVNYFQLDAYRFMVRTIKETEDEMYDMKEKNAGSNSSYASGNVYINSTDDKSCEIHIFVTRVPKTVDMTKFEEEEKRRYANAGVYKRHGEWVYDSHDKDLAKWGPHYSDEYGSRVQEKAPFTEEDIWRVLKNPNKDHPTILGNIHIHNGRPKWDDFFTSVARRHIGQDIGVMYCGPPIIAKDLKVKLFFSVFF